jgi:hypothetical protein
MRSAFSNWLAVNLSLAVLGVTVVVERLLDWWPASRSESQ